MRIFKVISFLTVLIIVVILTFPYVSGFNSVGIFQKDGCYASDVLNVKMKVAGGLKKRLTGHVYEEAGENIVFVKDEYLRFENAMLPIDQNEYRFYPIRCH
ncbi:MAG: hypothetical protein ACRBBP_11650 [Bdellovibrionales bacterium]